MYWDKKKVLLCCLLLCLFLGQRIAFAVQSDLDRVGEDIDDMENQKELQEYQLDEFSQEAGSLAEELRSGNEKLSLAAEKLTSLEQSLHEITAKVDAIQKDLDQARALEEKQLEGMKIRMRFLYENGESFPLELILEAESFTDAVNRSEYFAKIWAYDRRMLEEYRKTSTDISWKEQMLSEEQARQAGLKKEQEENRLSAEAEITAIKTELAQLNFQMDQSQAEISVYEELLAEQKEYEQELEEQKRLEEEQMLQYLNSLQQNETGAGTGYNGAASNGVTDGSMAGGSNTGNPVAAYPYTQSDIAFLGALIECEAGGESYEGKLAVGSVVMNRIRSPHFPNSLFEVVYQRKQFSPVGSGRFAVVLARGASAPCLQAAAEVLGGKNTLDSLFFRVNDGSRSGFVLGNHVFY